MTDERRRNIKMVYGSLAYDLDTLARERQLEEAGEMPQRTAQPERQPQPQTRRRPQAQAKARPSALTVGGIAAVCALVMVLLLGYVQLTAVSNNVSTIKTLEDEHVALLTEYEKTFDLATIKAAAEEAGMSKPSAGQIQYIDLSGADSAVVYGDEPGVVEKAASSLKEGALSLWEYFS